jgi:acetylornithine deacetylase
VQGGDSFNRIASSCQLDLEFRLLPGMEPEAFLEELRILVEGALRAGGWSYELSTVGAYDGYATPTDTAFGHEVETLCGCSARAVMFGTEAPFLARLGLETLIVGAGDIRVAHQPDEYVTMASIRRASNLYSQLIQRFCIEP